MKKYFVTIPICGSVSFCVEAENEEEAKEKAFESEEINKLKRNCNRGGIKMKVCSMVTLIHETENVVPFMVIGIEGTLYD